MLPQHVRITEIALGAAGRFGFALAGGYAVSAHGMGTRLSGDVDLFTAWHMRDTFPQAVDHVIQALADHGYVVDVVIRNDAFARLLVADQKRPDEEPDKRDPGFEPRAFAGALGALDQITDADFDCYRVAVADLPSMRERFADWRRQLLA